MQRQSIMHKKINNKRSDINKVIQQALNDKLGKTPSGVDPNTQLFQSMVPLTNDKIIVNRKRKPPSRMSRVANRNNHDEFMQRPDPKFLTKIQGNITRLKLERGSFNGSMIELNDKYLLVYRPHEYTFKACFLNYNFQIIDHKNYPIGLTVVADPRLIKLPDQRILLSYASFEQNDYIASNIIMDIKESEKLILTDKVRVSPEILHDRQKNWMPFVHEDKVYFIASVNPHIIYQFDYDSKNSAKKVYHTEWKHPWVIKKTLRGNTNAIQLKDGNYLSIFHTAMSKNGLIYYDNGAYIFEGKPPFRVLRCSKKTILPADAANEPHVRKANEIRCVFPMSLILQGERLLITYGDNDSCVKVLDTKLSDIMETMVSII